MILKLFITRLVCKKKKNSFTNEQTEPIQISVNSYVMYTNEDNMLVMLQQVA